MCSNEELIQLMSEQEHGVNSVLMKKKSAGVDTASQLQG